MGRENRNAPIALFHLEAGSHTGWGHYARCRAIALGLARHRFRCAFAVIDRSGASVDDGLEFSGARLQIPVTASDSAADLVDLCSRSIGTPAVLFVDRYGLSPEWFAGLEPSIRVIEINDKLTSPVAAQILVNPGAEEYHSVGAGDLLHGDRRRLFGWSFAPVDHNLRYWRTAFKVSGDLRRIGVSLGSGVDESTWECVMSCLGSLKSKKPEVRIEIVRDAQSLTPEHLERAAAAGLRLIERYSSPIEFMLNQDVIVGALGHSSWERLALGIPTVAIRTHDNQCALESLVRADLVEFAGDSSGLTSAKLSNALESLIAHDRRMDLSLRSRGAVDAFGAMRIADFAVTPRPKFRHVCRASRRHHGLISIDSFAAIDTVRTRSVEASREEDPGTQLGRVIATLRTRSDVWQVAPEFSSVLLQDDRPEVLGQLAISLLEHVGAQSCIEMISEVRVPKRARTIVGLCVTEGSWALASFGVPRLLAELLQMGLHVRFSTTIDDLGPCDTVFLVGYESIVTAEHRAIHKRVLVVHESDLPHGRGWSPLTWQVLAGVRRIKVCLIEAVDEIDAGPIVGSTWIKLEGTETLQELRQHQAVATRQVIVEYMRSRLSGAAPGGTLQVGDPTYHPRRTVQDSRVSPSSTLAEIFDQLRVADPDRYPTHFEYRGQLWRLQLDRDLD